MKLILLLAFVGLAASASLRPDLVSDASRKTLVYQYDTQIGTGIEEISNDFSTERMRFKVLMQRDESASSGTGARRWKIVFQTVNVRQRNNATEFLPKKLLPLEQFRNLENSDLWFSIERDLKRPFSAEISSNELTVIKVFFDRQDPFWSVNLKKGFLNLLQLNFQPRDASADSMATGRWSNEVNEMTTAASCKTQYSAERLQFHESESQLFRVSKAIDLNSCVNPMDGSSGLPGVWVGLHHSEPMQQQKKVLNNNHRAEYLVQMTSDMKPIIQKASSKAIYTQMPFSDSRQGTQKTIAIQKLELQDVREDEEVAVETSSQQEMPEGLRIIFPEEAQQVDQEAVLNEVTRLFQQLLKANKDMKIEVYEQILRLVRFHLNTEEQLRSIAQKLMREEGSKRLVQIFILDMCPQIGSRGSVQFLMQVVRQLVKEAEPWSFVTEAKLDASHITAIFTKLSLVSKLPLKTLELVLETISSEEFRSKLVNAERMPIFSSAWLSLGAMVNVYYSRQGGVEPYLFTAQEEDRQTLIRKYRESPWELRQQHAVKSEEFRRRFIQEVREALQKGGAMMTLALKVTKNCGLFELYTDVSRIVMKRSSNVYDRVEAVYATINMLRRHTLPRIFSEDPRTVMQEEKFIRDHQQFIRHFDTISRQIQADLVSCFRNVREDPEVRIACYRVLMQSPVKQTTLNMVMQVILSEPTQQVHAYCLQHMAQIAKQPLPRYRGVSRTVRAMLSTIERRDQLPSITNSRVFHAQLQDQLHDLGLSLETDMIMSDKSFTPRWTHIRLDQQAMGRNMPLLEFAIRTEGLQQMLEKILGPHGLFDDGIVKALNRMKRSIEAGDNTLDIVPRIVKELPNMDLTVSIMGYETIFVKNSRQSIDQSSKLNANSIMRSLNQLARIFSPLTRVFTVSGSYQLPTTVGTVLEMNCLTSIDFVPKVRVERNQVTSKRVSVLLRAEMPLTVQNFKRFGNNMHVLSHFVQLVTKAKANKDIQYTLGFDLNRQESGTWSLSLLHWNPSSEKQLIVFKTKANSIITELFFRSGAIVTNNLKQQLSHNRVTRPKIINTQPIINDIAKFFGLQLRIQGRTFSNEDLYQAPCAIFMGPSRFIISARTVGEESSNTLIKHRMEISYPMEKLNAPQISVSVDQVSAADTESVVKQIAKIQFLPKRFESSQFDFEIQLQQLIGNQRSFVMDGAVKVPENLPMRPTSVPFRFHEWFVTREMDARLIVKEQGATIMQLKGILRPNPRLQEILQDSSISQKQMLNMFPLLKQCLNETRKSLSEGPLSDNPLFTPSCVRQFRKFNKLDTLDFEMKMDSKERLVALTGCRLCRMAMQQMSDLLRPYLADVAPTRWSNMWKFVFNVVPSPVDRRVVNFNLSSPFEMTQWRSVQLPLTPFAWDSVDPIVTSIADYAKGRAAKCKLMNSHVRTFDDVIYSIPRRLFSQLADNQCPLLLARDCSQKKEFQVLTHIKDNRKFITVQLLPERSGERAPVIEVSKPIDSEEMQATLKVNDETVEQSTPTKEEAQIYTRTIHSNGKKITIVISQYEYSNTVMYKIRSVQQQLQVLVGGPKLRSVEIRVSPFYNNRMCGLCGDYNSEKFREFKGPNYHQVMTSAMRMTQQYVLPTSEACRAAKESPEAPENWENKLSFGSFDLIEKPSLDLPVRRPSCVIAKDSNKALTFKHAQIKLTSHAVKEMLRSTSCSLKLAVANIDGHKIFVYLKPSQDKVVVKSGSFEQELSILSPESCERSDDVAPTGLAVSMERSAHLVRFQVKKNDDEKKRLIVKVTSDKRIIIKADRIEQSEDSICELSQASQMQLDSLSVGRFLRKFTNKQHDATCDQQLRREASQCQVVGQTVLPFHRQSDYTRQSVQFLSSRLIRQLAQTKAPIVLSVDEISADSETAISAQLQLTMKDGQVQHNILVKKNERTVVKVMKPESGSAQVAYKKDGSEQIIRLPAADDTIDIDDNFQLQVRGEQVKVSAKASSYQILLKLSDSQPEISIMRAYDHSRYASTGLCKISGSKRSAAYHSNPSAVLEQVVRNSLAQAQAASEKAPIFSESDIAKLNEMLAKFDDSIFGSSDW